MANEYGNIAIERKRLTLSGIWIVAGKYGNWQEDIANGSKISKASKIGLMAENNLALARNYIKWYGHGRSCGKISEVKKKINVWREMAK